jgi:hypothetical protein
MRRGGVLIVTTFQRRFLPIPSDGSNDLGDRSPEEWFKAYDRGEFCFRRLPSVPGNPDFGDAFVPERYVRERWSMDFIIHEYFDAATLGQSIIVCQPLAA